MGLTDRPGAACKLGVAKLLRELADARPPIGSNEWAVGANVPARTLAAG